MPITGIQRIYSESHDRLMFVKLENTVNNRYIEGSSTTDVGDCWVPWCENITDLLKKGIILVNRSKGTLVGFVWQQKDKHGDDRVRFSKVGWEEPSTSNRIPGFSEVNTKINLKIDVHGNVSAEKSSPN